ncbi:MAG: DUF4349 domain-containing protein [Chloroflexota bacterium]|nr:DUF4349 domain-containing protein [Chloroflexota bacterium]
MPPLFLVTALTLGLLGCGAAAEMGFDEMAASSPAQPQMASDAFVIERAVPEEMAVTKEVKAMPAAPAAQPTAVPQAMAMETAESNSQLLEQNLPSIDEVQASVAAQNRIIVRTVGMGLIVDNVADAVDLVGDVALELGGWTVSSDRNAIHRGSVSVRVPAQQLDEAVRRIRALGNRVDWESSTSQDVTDEYVDSNSRLRSLRATEEALLNLLNKAQDVEDALEVQRELTDLQAEIESLEGRIKFLEQTAAYSLINVTLTLAPKPMAIDAGPDQTFSAGQPARFRATFTPPQGIDTYSFVWDFGDGSRAGGSGTAPTTEPGQRVTATVTHFFEDDTDSPYIVQLELTGTGPAGLVEGTDTLIATVTRIPTIEVFSGESRFVEEGEEVEYTGSFTRGDGLWDLQYRWDFSDGSPTITGIPEEGDTRATASHTFENYRPDPYEVTLTVTAQSEAGEVRGSSSFSVFVTESQGLVVGNWDLLESAKWAIRSLSAVALAVVNIIIWVAIFSPVWLGIGALGYGGIRLKRYWSARRRRNRPYEGTELSTVPSPPEAPLPGEEGEAVEGRPG